MNPYHFAHIRTWLAQDQDDHVLTYMIYMYEQNGLDL